jgi:3'(2'), 5'-bisphosphate nucleotidase
MKLYPLLCKVIPIAVEAGEAIMSIYNNEDRGIEYKEDQSPLTIADRLSNEVIIRGLQNITPSFPIISEESENMTYSKRIEHDYIWIVDPLDGTREFIYRNDEFCVNIALIHKNKSVLGVMYIPAAYTIFYGVQNEGAYMVKNGISCRLDTRFYTKNKNWNVAVSKSYINKETSDYINQHFSPNNTIPAGSATKFAMLCNGVADVYPRLGTTMEWDIAAPQIILEEAGGAVINRTSKMSLEYNKADLKNPEFIAVSNKQYLDLI